MLQRYDRPSAPSILLQSCPLQTNLTGFRRGMIYMYKDRVAYFKIAYAYLVAITMTYF